MWLVRRADVWGQVGHAGVVCRPRLPSRARRFSSFLVGEDAGEDDVGQASREGSHGHHGWHPAGLAGVVVDAAFGLVSELDVAMMCSARLIRRFPARESR